MDRRRRLAEGAGELEELEEALAAPQARAERCPSTVKTCQLDGFSRPIETSREDLLSFGRVKTH